jgi:hypothetical protein
MAAQNNALSAAERQADKSADDAYLAAVSALLTAMATDSRILEEEAEVLADSLPDAEMHMDLIVWLRWSGLLPDYSENGGGPL